jgi:hypothetical protein
MRRATVGYGDLAPVTTLGRLVTIAYVIIGLGIFVAAVTAIADTVIAQRNKDLSDDRPDGTRRASRRRRWSPRPPSAMAPCFDPGFSLSPAGRHRLCRGRQGRDRCRGRRALGRVLSGGLGRQACVPRSRRRLLAAVGLLLVLPLPPGFVVSTALIVAAAAAGTRVAVVVLLGAVMAATGLSQGSTAWILPLALAGVVAGCLAVEHLGPSTILPRAPATAEAGLRLGLFLALGVALSLALVLVIDMHRSYWIAIIFVSRALLPMQHRPQALLRYSKGAAAGVLFAVAVELAGLLGILRLLVPLAALIAGLRFLTYPIPVSSGAFTVAVLLGTAPTLAEAAFRLETVALVIGMILFVTLLLDRLWTALVDPEHGSKEEAYRAKARDGGQAV